jgi:hypothetical protein
VDQAGAAQVERRDRFDAFGQVGAEQVHGPVDAHVAVDEPAGLAVPREDGVAPDVDVRTRDHELRRAPDAAVAGQRIDAEVTLFGRLVHGAVAVVVDVVGAPVGGVGRVPYLRKVRKRQGRQGRVVEVGQHEVPRRRRRPRAEPQISVAAVLEVGHGLRQSGFQAEEAVLEQPLLAHLVAAVHDAQRQRRQHQHGYRDE